MNRRRLWQEPGWLPALSIVEWNRLARQREAHETAVAAFLSAKNTDAEDAATLALCDVTEAALADLSTNSSEGEEAYRAVCPKVMPKTLDGEIPPGYHGDWEDWNKRAAKANAKYRAEAAKLMPKRKALERDRKRLDRLKRILTPNVLTEARLIPQAQHEVEEERERIAQAVAAASETLEDRVERLERAQSRGGVTA